MFFGNNRALEQRIAELEKENEQLKEKLKNEDKIFEEINDVLMKIAKGLCGFKVRETSNDPKISRIIQNINNAVDYYTTYGDEAVDILINYGNADFAYSVETKGLSGKLGSIILGIRALGSSISELFALIDTTAEDLNLQMKELSNASNSLASSANSQAARLEETAAALEEVTSTIVSTSENTELMAQISNEVNNSASKGQELANNTFESMESINHQVGLIDDAITVIDQIAFQTNILSLNAAVEAATAGEAGKGFAVVAQEVRNLASRSADAAKEIKDIVQNAKEKAGEGKHIATNMIDGYTTLNENIDQQLKIIEDVSNASREQRQAIEQINDAVTSLDKATQQNASAAMQIDSQTEHISVLAQQLVNTVERTKYKNDAKEQICDMESVFTLNALKLDHINFKDSNYKKLGERTSWSVTDHHSCRLGKWIDEQERTNKPFTQTQNWKHLKEVHESVHKNVQTVVTKNAAGEDILSLVEEIDENISDTFWSIQEIKKENCRSIKHNDRRGQKVNLSYSGPERRSIEKGLRESLSQNRNNSNNSNDNEWASF